jgi:hypothetical protein
MKHLLLALINLQTKPLTIVDEGAEFLTTSKLLHYLSNNSLMTSLELLGNERCNEDLLDNSFSYLEGAPLGTESDYQYNAMDGDCY